MWHVCCVLYIEYGTSTSTSTGASEKATRKIFLLFVVAATSFVATVWSVAMQTGAHCIHSSLMSQHGAGVNPLVLRAVVASTYTPIHTAA